ncbi:MAG: acetyl-CoA carboxylase biotin carboxylase subunit [Chloroflexi bacterium]|nr:acetyl-CoA carboxylase biotin carboxylase subunit [Chloroflexota bacterium]
MKTPFKKVLIANRGEIAVRIIRACRQLGLGTVAVYSEADRQALHVRLADEAFCVGPPPARQSYLRGEALVEIARRSAAEAVHPGYGFLAENAAFAQMVREAGLVFVGPAPDSIALMGDKVRARRAARAAGVPVVPGTDGEVSDVAEAAAVAGAIGYPILLKAAAGGGGKGMRVVRAPEDLASAFQLASSEAHGAFGHGGLYVERRLEGVRHIEFQVIGDRYGNVVHLGERECSIQRRLQKLVEEAPSTALDDALRERMGQAAVAAARAAQYENAGTVEFLLDADRTFYFLEMNTRLQVEHPVTELVTGLDLVAMQLRVAAGEPLGLRQDDVRLRGWAIECRISAEDPANSFLPSIGTVGPLREPSGPGVRVDSALYHGLAVSLYYDPLLAKVIVWAADRPTAIRRMRQALGEFRIGGVHTTIPFHLRLLDLPEFRMGAVDTAFLEERFAPADGEPRDAGVVALLAALLTDERRQRRQAALAATVDGPASSGWRARGWRETLRRW